MRLRPTLISLPTLATLAGLAGSMILAGCLSPADSPEPSPHEGSESLAPLSNAEIEAVLASGLGEMRTCFASLLAEPHGAKGVLTLQWLVGGTGRVEEVQAIQSDFAERVTRDLMRCLEPKVLALPFPATRGGRGLRITYPFVVR